MVVVLNVQQQNFVHLDVIVMIVEIQNAIVATVVFCVKKKKKEEMHVVHNVKMFVQIVFLCVPVLMLVRSVKLFSAVGRGVLMVLSAISVRFIVIHFVMSVIDAMTAMVVKWMKMVVVKIVHITVRQVQASKRQQRHICMYKYMYIHLLPASSEIHGSNVCIHLFYMYKEYYFKNLSLRNVVHSL